MSSVPQFAAGMRFRVGDPPSCSVPSLEFRAGFLEFFPFLDFFPQLDIRHVSQLPSSIWIITAAPSSSSQHNTAQQLHAVSNGHVCQPPCLPTVSPYHRVSHKCRWHPSPPWSSRSCPAVGHSHPLKLTHDDEHRTAAFASRPSLRILSRDLSLVLHHLPSRLL